MVVFTCNGCGDSLRKNKVQAHIFQGRCRNSAVSCIDCGKDFWGNDFDKHTTCISEAEKYSGKNYVPKPNANKGEQKQQEWLMQVESAIQKVQTNPQLREIFERMKGYSNIPRKEKPFKNFLRNSLAVWKEDLCNQVWSLLNANVDKPNNGPTTNQSSAGGNPNMNGSSKGSVNGHVTDSSGDTQSRPLSKREKKEHRQKQSHKAEKKDKHSVKTDNENGNIQNGDEKKKKKRKRKHDDEDEEAEEQNSAKKVKKDSKESGDPAGETTQEKHFKPKFRWQAMMLEVVKAKGELKIKKLRKKVLAEYMSMGCTEKPEENLYAKFDKKLKKHPDLKVFNDRVKLAS